MVTKYNYDLDSAKSENKKLINKLDRFKELLYED